MKKTVLLTILAVFCLTFMLQAADVFKTKDVISAGDMNETVKATLTKDSNKENTLQKTSEFTGGIIFWDDFETDTYEWLSKDLTNPFPEPNRWLVDSWMAAGDSSWRCADTSLGNNGGYANGWYQVLDTPPITLTADTAVFTFIHRHNIEGTAGAEDPYDGWDGMNVRISVDSGMTWQVLETGTYDMTSCWAFGHPQQGANEGPGIPAWAGTQDAWTRETVNLTPYIDPVTPVMLRFAFASDQGFSTSDGGPDLWGWMIDSIEVMDGMEMVFSNYGTTEDLVGMSNAFVPPPGGALWHLAESVVPNTLPAFDPEYEPSYPNIAVVQNGGELFSLDSTYNPYMDAVMETAAPISLPDTTPIYLDFKFVPYFADADAFPEVEYYRTEVRPVDSTSWTAVWVGDGGEQWVMSDGFDQWTEWAWFYGSLPNTSWMDLSRHAGEDVHIRFRFWSDNDDPIGPGLLVDDVVLYSPINPPEIPADLSVEAFPEDTTAELSWTAEEGVTYEVWYSNPVEFPTVYLLDVTTEGSYVDTTIQAWEEKYYFLRASVKYEGTSDFSDGVVAFIFPSVLSEFGYDDGEPEDYLMTARRMLSAVKFTPPYYPVEFNTIRVHLDSAWVDGEDEPQDKGKYQIWTVDSLTGLPGEELFEERVSSGLDTGFNYVHFEEKVRVDTGSFYIVYDRYTRSNYVSLDTSDPDTLTYFQYEDTTEAGTDTTIWAVSDSFDAIIRVLFDTTMADIPQDTTGIDLGDAVLADKFILGKNYPNPFNPVTTIPFVVPSSAAGQDLTLEIFNILGQKVVTLYDGKAKAGLNRMSWDGVNKAGREVSSGIYLYRLKTDNVTMTKRMLLIK